MGRSRCHVGAYLYWRSCHDRSTVSSCSGNSWRGRVRRGAAAGPCTGHRSSCRHWARCLRARDGACGALLLSTGSVLRIPGSVLLRAAGGLLSAAVLRAAQLLEPVLPPLRRLLATA